MANKIMNPSSARRDFYKLLKEVNESHSEVEIVSDNETNNAVLIGRKDWESIKETLHLEQAGVLEVVRERENDDSGFTDIKDIDWDNI